MEAGWGKLMVLILKGGRRISAIGSVASLGILVIIIMWVGCFVVVTINSAFRGISPVFWSLVALFGGPFALLAYGLVRSQAK